MSLSDVVVVDYGMGNLFSIRKGFEFCGASVQVTSDPEQILNASRVLLPGVGAFANAMAELKSLHLDQALREIKQRGTPLLGICLGMQLLLDSSEEFGYHKGLGFVSGQVVRIPETSIQAQPLKVPHIGWAEIHPRTNSDWQGSILADSQPGEAFYFVHSYMAKPADALTNLADCDYGGVSICAAISHENIFGCQFHPEKSGQAGLSILKRFLAL